MFLFLLTTRTPPGQIYDLESRMQEEEENEPPMEAVVIPYEPGGRFTSQYTQLSLDFDLTFLHVCTLHFSVLISAYMNVNTNATTRGDAQVSRHPSHLSLK